MDCIIYLLQKSKKKVRAKGESTSPRKKKQEEEQEVWKWYEFLKFNASPYLSPRLRRYHISLFKVQYIHRLD